MTDETTVTLGPTLGADLLDQLQPPTKPPRISQRTYRELWDSTPHAVEHLDTEGRRIGGCTVAGRLSAAAIVGSLRELIVGVRPGRLPPFGHPVGADLAPTTDVAGVVQ